MKIGIDVTSLTGGRGPARYTEEILLSLSQHSARDDIFYLYTPYKINKIQYRENFVHRHLPTKAPWPWLNAILPLHAIKDDIDLMFFPANDFWLFPFKRTVVTIHDMASYTYLYRYQKRLIDRLQIKLQAKRLRRVALSVITGSQYSLGQIRFITGVPHKKINVVPYGIRQDLFFINNRNKSNYILYVGGFDKRKNLERLLKAYRKIINEGNNIKMILAGSSGENDKLYYNMESLIKENRLEGKAIIKYNPSDKELIELYNTALLLVMPSIIEGFGLPVLEAMACGCPVVCSHAASLPEVGGDAAVYFDPYDVDDMVQKIGMVLKDNKLRNKMIIKGKQQINKFSWDEAGRRVYKILVNSCLG